MKPGNRLVVCIDNTGYPVSLEQGGIYQTVDDPTLEEQSEIRVIDESGEDYIYDISRFKFLDVETQSPGTLVEHDGVRGVVIKDEQGLYPDGKTTIVVYEGTTYGTGTPTSELRIVGTDMPVADFKKCGAGRGPDCCIFLVCGPDGLECARFGNLRNLILARQSGMNAQRNPAEMYPQCQLE